ncbi:hypothetical protein ACFO3O_17500 [Dokdonia ponticola]|uniref:DNA-binding protein n=1 Tax=Dokdonia ponticola TaxID=2041041 RepID=A0ABV9HZX2_9FLAO
MESNKFYELKELRNILPITDQRTITKWLSDHHIPIQTIAGKKVVHRFMVDMEIDKSLVKELKKKYPEKWEELYTCYQDNDRLGYLLLLDDDFVPTKRYESILIKDVEQKSSLAAQLLKG